MGLESKSFVEKQNQKTGRFFFNSKDKALNFTRILFAKSFGQEQCCVCGKDSCAVPICKTCIEKKLFSFNSPGEKRCSICGKVLVSEDGKCMDCRESPVLQHTDFVFPLYPYRLWNKMLLFEWKIQNKRALSLILAKAVYKALCFLFPSNLPPVVPVPPRPGKIRARGWDQIDDLCIYLSKMYGVKILKLLERTTSKQQKKLDREERLKTKGKSYILRQDFSSWSIKHQIPEEAVLLDDVLTTGITVENCAVLLKEAGVIKVNALTLFIVD